MKRVYTGLDAIKISLDGATMLTANSTCWEYVANRVGVQLTCNTEDTGKVGEWVDYSAPGFPATAPDYC